MHWRAHPVRNPLRDLLPLGVGSVQVWLGAVVIICQGPGDGCYCGSTGCNSSGMAITPTTAPRYFEEPKEFVSSVPNPWQDYWPEVNEIHESIVRAVKRARRQREAGIGVRNFKKFVA